MKYAPPKRRPASANSMVNVPKPKPKPAWDDTIHDLKVHKLNSTELEERRKSIISKNKEFAKQELNTKQKKPSEGSNPLSSDILKDPLFLKNFNHELDRIMKQRQAATPFEQNENRVYDSNSYPPSNTNNIHNNNNHSVIHNNNNNNYPPSTFLTQSPPHAVPYISQFQKHQQLQQEHYSFFANGGSNRSTVTPSTVAPTYPIAQTPAPVISHQTYLHPTPLPSGNNNERDERPLTPISPLSTGNRSPLIVRAAIDNHRKVEIPEKVQTFEHHKSQFGGLNPQGLVDINDEIQQFEKIHKIPPHPNPTTQQKITQNKTVINPARTTNTSFANYNGNQNHQNNNHGNHNQPKGSLNTNILHGNVDNAVESLDKIAKKLESRLSQIENGHSNDAHDESHISRDNPNLGYGGYTGSIMNSLLRVTEILSKSETMHQERLAEQKKLREELDAYKIYSRDLETRLDKVITERKQLDEDFRLYQQQTEIQMQEMKGQLDRLTQSKNFDTLGHAITSLRTYEPQQPFILPPSAKPHLSNPNTIQMGNRKGAVIDTTKSEGYPRSGFINNNNNNNTNNNNNNVVNIEQRGLNRAPNLEYNEYSKELLQRQEQLMRGLRTTGVPSVTLYQNQNNLNEQTLDPRFG